MNGKKISAHAAGLALAIVAAWAIKQWAKIDVPDPVLVSLGTLATMIVSILLPDTLEAE